MAATGKIAAPRPLFEASNHLRAQRVQDGVTGQLKQVAVLFDQNGFEASLKYVADALMAAVESLGIHAVQLAHAFREVGIRGFDNQMIVVGHLAIGVTNPVEPFADFPERFKPSQTIFIGKENILASVAARSNVIDSAG